MSPETVITQNVLKANARTGASPGKCTFGKSSNNQKSCKESFLSRDEFPLFTLQSILLSSESADEWIYHHRDYEDILELRKEKSRDAARSRRGKENYEFYELAKMLPLPAAITSQLDKASIIRLTISYLKLRDFTRHGDPQWNRDSKTVSKIVKSNAASRGTSAGLALELFEQHQGTHILQSLDGFALAIAADGRFLYISETVSIYLGLSQVEMTGSSFFDYVHQGDHAEIADQLGLVLADNGTSHSSGMTSSTTNDEASGINNPDVHSVMSLNGSNYKGYERAFCVRMKSTLTKRGCHFKSSGYRVILLLCHLRPQYSFSHQKKNQPPLLGMTAIAVALPPPSVHEIRLECDMFVTKINFDFRISHCEPRITELLEFSSEELVGESLYTLCHGEDSEKLRKCHSDLISKGQVLTHYYRIMNKNGGYTWIQTCATVVCSAKNADEQNIICVNYVISGKEKGDWILDQLQLGIIKHEPVVCITKDEKRNTLETIADGSKTTENIESTDSTSKSTEVLSHSAEESDKTCRNESIPATMSKRGRKRKVKFDAQDIPVTTNDNEISESSFCGKSSDSAMSKHLQEVSVTNKSRLLSKSEDPSKILLMHQPSAPMPATALLRQLYANRESVIRATTRPSNFIHSSNTQQQSLLTPPNDSFDSQYMKKPGENFCNLMNYGVYASMDYNNDMTPPNSVSPTNQKTSANYEYSHLPYEGRLQFESNNSTESNSHHHIPLKSQPYSLHHIDPAYSIEQSQYFPYHSSFHLYHKGNYTPP